MKIKNVKNGLKVCPRCNEKCKMNEPSCPECGLVFSRLSNASNKLGRKKSFLFKRNEYFLSSIWPEDASRLKALLLCGFFGIWGAHNFYLGRFIKAFYVLVMFIVAITLYLCFSTSPHFDTIMSLIALPGSFITIFWISDFIHIAVGKYRIPVALKKDENNG